MKAISAMTLIVSAGLLGALSTAEAATPTDPSVLKYTVSYADLKLDTAKDVDVLYSRLSRAARAVCGDPMGSRALSSTLDANSCRKQAIDRAVRQISSPALSAYHASKTGQPQAGALLTREP